MRIGSLGHVVLRVRDLDRAQDFYHGLLGLPISARSEEWSMIFFTLGQHHDFAVAVLADDAELPVGGQGGGQGGEQGGGQSGERGGEQVGLDHVAFKLAGGLESLRDAKALLEGKGIPVAPIDHVVTKSIYFKDPDGNGIELFIDGDEKWREDASLILSESAKLEL